MTDFFIRVKQQQEQELPFVIYNKPDDSVLTGYFQGNDHLYFVNDFKERGFVFAPFDGNQIILFPEEHCELRYADLDVSKVDKAEIKLTDDADAKKKFTDLVQKGIDGVNKGLFSKVVLSRKEILDIPDFDAVVVFERMVNAYPSAMTYCWYHPKIGMWLGATPEQLLKGAKNQFYSVALAGTQQFNGTTAVDWQKKEQEEQHFVTEYILENLRDVASEVVISSPYTAQAGDLLHLKSDIEGTVSDNADLGKVISVLHPTPAVCGLPKLTAKDFILQNEGYDREYYTGYLGELNKNLLGISSETDIFVNLRCMQIIGNTAHLYIGCGITKDSIPENEYTESVNKSMTMKKILL
ncbi:MAG TPA: isochorismate synthase [Flavobacterium sp.]|jgi:isochorismate synthase